VDETKFGETNPFIFHSQQIGIALIQTQIDIMDQIKLGIFDLERQDRERERFAHERGQLTHMESIDHEYTLVMLGFVVNFVNYEYAMSKIEQE
jgi:hypothetical protein